MKKFLIFLILITLLIAGYLILNNDNKTKSKNTKIKIGEVTHSIFYAPQYAAHKLGYFKKEGLDVNFILTPGGDKKKRRKKGNKKLVKYDPNRGDNQWVVSRKEVIKRSPRQKFLERRRYDKSCIRKYEWGHH